MDREECIYFYFEEMESCCEDRPNPPPPPPHAYFVVAAGVEKSPGRPDTLWVSAGCIESDEELTFEDFCREDLVSDRYAYGSVSAEEGSFDCGNLHASISEVVSDACDALAASITVNSVSSGC